MDIDGDHIQNHDWLTLPANKPVIAGFSRVPVPEMGLVPSCSEHGSSVMASTAKDNVDYRLLNRLSDLVICSRCLQQGKVTPVPQVISDRHVLSNQCPNCRHEKARQSGLRRSDVTREQKIRHPVPLS